MCRVNLILLTIAAVAIASGSEVTLYAQQTELFQSSLKTSDDFVSELVDGTSQVESLADLYPEDGSLGRPYKVSAPEVSDEFVSQLVDATSVQPDSLANLYPEDGTLGHHKEVADEFVSQLVAGSSTQPESLADLYPEDGTLGHTSMLLQTAATQALLDSVSAEVEKRITNPEAKANAFKMIHKLSGKHLQEVLRILEGRKHAPDWNPKIRKLVHYILAQQAVKRGVETFEAPDKKHLEQDDATSTRVMPQGGEESVNGKFDHRTPSGKKVRKAPVRDEIGIKTSIQNHKSQTGV